MSFIKIGVVAVVALLMIANLAPEAADAVATAVANTNIAGTPAAVALNLWWIVVAGIVVGLGFLGFKKIRG